MYQSYATDLNAEKFPQDVAWCQRKSVYRGKVLSGQETIHSRIGKKKQVKTAIDEIEEKLNEVSKKLDADEVDLRDLQVSNSESKDPSGRFSTVSAGTWSVSGDGQNGAYKIFMLGTFLSFYSFWSVWH